MSQKNLLDNYNLIKKRGNEDMKRENIIQKLNISSEEVAKYKSNPETIPYGLVQKLDKEFRTTPEEVFGIEKPKRVFEVANNRFGIERISKSIHDYLEEHSNDSESEDYKNASRFIGTMADKLTAKPKVVLLGRSDSGKSTLTNHLLGVDKLPTDWQPMTTIIVYIKHIAERPAYMGENTVWIFKNDEYDNVYDDTRLNDEVYTRSLFVAGGNEELLSDYGTRVGKSYETSEGSEDTIGSAVLFVDSPILETCDILDVPGFTGGRPSDEKAAVTASAKADILIYLSQANSFMCKEDFVYLKGAIETLPVVDGINNPMMPKLANIFVVATQADIINHGNKEDITRILQCGCERFNNTLVEDFWKEKTNISHHQYTLQDLQSRFYSFSTKYDDLCIGFENALRKTLEELPKAMEHQLIDAIVHQCNGPREEILEKLKVEYTFRDEREAVETEYRKRVHSEASIKQELEDNRSQVNAAIENSRLTSREAFVKEFHGLFNETRLVDLLKSRGTKIFKKSREEFASYLSNRCDDILKDIKGSEAEKLKAQFDSYTERCQNVLNSGNWNSTVSGDVMKGFNAKRAFTAGFAGAAAYGALGIWASTLGNLGGYIIAAKVTSALAALGIHLGGTAAVISTVAAAGGPIFWGIGAAILLALSIFGITSSGWRGKFAREICKQVESKNMLQDFLDNIDAYWNETKEAFNLGADNIVEEWDKETTRLKETLGNYDIETINRNIADLEATLQLYDNIPREELQISKTFNV